MRAGLRAMLYCIITSIIGFLLFVIIGCAANRASVISSSADSAVKSDTVIANTDRSTTRTDSLTSRSSRTDSIAKIQKIYVKTIQHDSIYVHEKADGSTDSHRVTVINNDYFRFDSINSITRIDSLERALGIYRDSLNDFKLAISNFESKANKIETQVVKVSKPRTWFDKTCVFIVCFVLGCLLLWLIAKLMK